MANKWATLFLWAAIFLAVLSGGLMADPEASLPHSDLSMELSLTKSLLQVNFVDRPRIHGGDPCPPGLLIHAIP